MTGCNSCGASDELLFTCSHCEDQFCAAHQFPHHACRRFTSAGRTADRAEAAGFEFGDGTTALTPAVEEPEDDHSGGDDDPAGGKPPGHAGSGPSEAPGEGAAGKSAIRGEVDPGQRIEVARDAARETRPDRSGPAPAPPNRGMPWERDAGSVVEWIDAQSYPSYVLRVGGLSLLFTAAFYGGLAVTLYGHV